jgi:putative oxidoreductase
MDSARNAAVLVGRLLLAFIFLPSGLMKIASWNATAGYMASKGMTAIGLFLSLAIIVEVLGSLSLMSGIGARWGALALALYLIPVTLVFHNFWAFSGMQHQMQMANFLKNLSIIGGLWVVVGFGAGRYSLDAWLERRRHQGQEPDIRPLPGLEGAR